MTITTVQKPVFRSDLTGCEYESYDDAAKAEFRELLAQALVSDGPVGMNQGEYYDLATWFADRYTELWKPKAKEPDAVFANVVKKIGQLRPIISEETIATLLTTLFREYKVTIKEPT